MPDQLGEYRDMIVAEATRRAEVVLSGHSVPAGVNTLAGGTPTIAYAGVANQFMSGYSGGVTVFPFMLDLSVLDGPDLLAE